MTNSAKLGFELAIYSCFEKIKGPLNTKNFEWFQLFGAHSPKKILHKHHKRFYGFIWKLLFIRVALKCARIDRVRSKFQRYLNLIEATDGIF